MNDPHELTRLRAQVKSIEYSSPGSVARPEEWPDDSEVNEAISEAGSFNEALFELADKYKFNVTNNMSRWQDGEFIYEFGEFVDDMRDIVKKHIKEFDA